MKVGYIVAVTTIVVTALVGSCIGAPLCPGDFYVTTSSTHLANGGEGTYWCTEPFTLCAGDMEFVNGRGNELVVDGVVYPWKCHHAPGPRPITTDPWLAGVTLIPGPLSFGPDRMAGAHEQDSGRLSGVDVSHCFAAGVFCSMSFWMHTSMMDGTLASSGSQGGDFPPGISSSIFQTENDVGPSLALLVGAADLGDGKDTAKSSPHAATVNDSEDPMADGDYDIRDASHSDSASGGPSGAPKGLRLFLRLMGQEDGNSYGGFSPSHIDVPPNKWTLLVITQDDKAIRLYINQEEAIVLDLPTEFTTLPSVDSATPRTSSATLSSSPTLRFGGGHKFPALKFDVAAARLYSHVVLDIAQVAAMSRAGVPITSVTGNVEGYGPIAPNVTNDHLAALAPVTTGLASHQSGDDEIGTDAETDPVGHNKAVLRRECRALKATPLRHIAIGAGAFRGGLGDEVAGQSLGQPLLERAFSLALQLNASALPATMSAAGACGGVAHAYQMAAAAAIDVIGAQGIGVDVEFPYVGAESSPPPKPVGRQALQRDYEDTQPLDAAAGQEQKMLWDHSMALAKNGDIVALNWVAVQYYWGTNGVAKDLDLARHYLLQAADGGSVEAMHNLGVMHLYGHGVTADKDRAYAYFLKAAESGYAQSVTQVALMLAQAQDADSEKIMGMLRSSADAGGLDALYALGRTYEKGLLGIEPNLDVALLFYTQAAEKKHTMAMHAAALLHMKRHAALIGSAGDAPVDECMAAVMLWKDVSERGAAVAKTMEDAVTRYRAGYIGEALALYRSASHMGVATAMRNVAFIADSQCAQLANVEGTEPASHAFRAIAAEQQGGAVLHIDGAFPWTIAGTRRADVLLATQQRRQNRISGSAREGEADGEGTGKVVATLSGPVLLQGADGATMSHCFDVHRECTLTAWVHISPESYPPHGTHTIVQTLQGMDALNIGLYIGVGGTPDEANRLFFQIHFVGDVYHMYGLRSNVTIQPHQIGAWTHVAIVMDRHEARGYMDGVCVMQHGVPAHVRPVTPLERKRLRIGGSQVSTAINGAIAWLTMRDIAMSGEEIAADRAETSLVDDAGRDQAGAAVMAAEEDDDIPAAGDATMRGGPVDSLIGAALASRHQAATAALGTAVWRSKRPVFGSLRGSTTVTASSPSQSIDDSLAMHVARQGPSLTMENENQPKCEAAALFFRRAARDAVTQFGRDGRPRIEAVELEDDAGISRNMPGYTGESDEFVHFQTYMATQADHAGAQNWLGHQYYWGNHGLDQDRARARDLLARAAEQDQAAAAYTLGVMALHGHGMEPDREQAKAHFEKAAGLGFLSGLGALGAMALDTDKEQALRLFLQAARGGDLDAMYNSASLLRRGGGARHENPALALQLAFRAAEAGHVHAQDLVASLLYSGEAGPQDCSLALHYWRLAAGAGDHAVVVNKAGSNARKGDNAVALKQYVLGTRMGVPLAAANAANVMERLGVSTYTPTTTDTASKDSASDVGGDDAVVVAGSGVDDKTAGTIDNLYAINKYNNNNNDDKTAGTIDNLYAINKYNNNNNDDKTDGSVTRLELLLAAAEEGDARAMLRVGDAVHGRDPHAALLWYRAASRRGVPQATFNIAMAYLMPPNVEGVSKQTNSDDGTINIDQGVAAVVRERNVTAAMQFLRLSITQQVSVAAARPFLWLADVLDFFSERFASSPSSSSSPTKSEPATIKTRKKTSRIAGSQDAGIAMSSPNPQTAAIEGRAATAGDGADHNWLGALIGIEANIYLRLAPFVLTTFVAAILVDYIKRKLKEKAIRKAQAQAKREAREEARRQQRRRVGAATPKTPGTAC